VVGRGGVLGEKEFGQERQGRSRINRSGKEYLGRGFFKSCGMELSRNIINKIHKNNQH